MQYSSKNNLKLMQGSDKIKRQDFVDNFEIIDDGLSKFYVATLTSENVYKVTTGLNKTSLSNGYSIRVAIPSNSTGAVSITVDSVTVPVKKPNGTAVTMFYAGAVYTLNYNNSVFISASDGSAENVSFTSDKLLTGYSANNTNGEKIEGTMPNNKAVFPTLNCDSFYIIPKGYHNGAGVVTVNSLASQTPGNAGPENLLSGKIAYSNGAKMVGVMPNNGSSVQTVRSLVYDNKLIFRINGGYYGGASYSDGKGQASVCEPLNYVADVLGITANKIVAGNNICGVNGTATVQNIQQYKVTEMNYASGAREWNLSNVWTYPNSILTAIGTFKVGTNSYSLYITAAFTEYVGVVYRKNTDSGGYIQIRSNGYYNTGSGIDYDHVPNNGHPYTPANALPIGSNSDFGSGSASEIDITVTCYRF